MLNSRYLKMLHINLMIGTENKIVVLLVELMISMIIYAKKKLLIFTLSFDLKALISSNI